MFFENIEKILLFYRRNTKIILILVFCVVSVLLLTWTIFDNKNYQFVPGKTFEEVSLEYGIKEVLFSFRRPVLDFQSYRQSEQDILNMLDISFDPPVSGSVQVIGSDKFRYVFDKTVSCTNVLKIFYDQSKLVDQDSTNTLFINYIESTNNPFIIKPSYPKVSYSSRVASNLNDPVELYFDKPIRLNLLKKALQITSESNKKISYRLVYAVSTNTDFYSRIIETNYNRIFVHMYSLKPHTEYKITVNYHQIYDDCSEDNIFDSKFSTYSKAGFVGFSNTPYYMSESRDLQQSNIFIASEPIWLLSRTALEENTNSLSTLVSEPPVENLTYKVYANGIEINGDFQAGQTYQLNFTPKNVKDIYGQKLENEFSGNVQIVHRPASIHQGGNTLVVPRNNPQIPIEFVNVTNIKVSYQFTRISEYIALILRNEPVHLETYTTNISVTNDADQSEWKYFDLTNIVKNKSGLVLIKFQIPGSTNQVGFTKVLVTCSALMTHVSSEDLFVYAYQAKDLKPIDNMTIYVWDNTRRGFQDLGMTKSDGILRVPHSTLPKQVLQKPIFIGISTANTGDITFSGDGISTFEGFDRKNFFSSANLAYASNNCQGRLKTLFFSNRPVYKPGEVVNIHAVARARKNNLYTSEKECFSNAVSVTIYSPNNNVLTNFMKKWSEYGSIDMSIPLDEDAESGFYQVQMRQSTFDFNTSMHFRVEPLAPNQAEVVITTDTTWYCYGNNIAVSFAPQFFSGEPVNTKIDYRMMLHPSPYRSKLYPEYHFGDFEIARPFIGGADAVSSKVFAQGTIKYHSQSGNSVVKKKLTAPFSQNARLHISAKAKPDNLPSFESVHAGIDIYVPIQLGIFSSKQSVIPNTDMVFKLIALMSDSEKIASNVPVVFEIKKVQNIDLKIFGFITNLIPIFNQFEKTVYKKSIRLGRETVHFVPTEPASYKAVLTSVQQGRLTKTVFSFQVLETQKESLDLLIESDKNSYSSGDQANIYISNPFEKAHLLITVERDLIREFHMVETSERIIRYPVLITTQDEPGLNITAVVRKLSDASSKDNDSFISDIKIGSLYLSIPPVDKQLAINIKGVKSSYKPGCKVKFSINAYSYGSRVNGQAVVMINDRAVLALEKQRIPDPVEFFYSSRPKSFSTWDSGKLLYDFLDLTNKMFVDVPTPFVATRMFAADSADNTQSIVRSNFNYTPFYEGALSLRSNQDTEIEFTLPDNISGFNISVIAYDKNQHFGKTNVSFHTVLPFSIEPIFPKFVRPNDSPDWGVLVKNFTANKVNAHIILNSPFDQILTNISIESSNISSILYSSKVEDLSYTDTNLWKASSSAPYNQSVELNIPLIVNNAWETTAFSGLLKGKTNISIPLIPYKEVLSQKIVLQVSGSPLLKVKLSIQDIISNQSLYLETLIKRITTIAGHEKLLSDKKVFSFNEAQLKEIVLKDIKSLQNYISEMNVLNALPNTELPASQIQLFDALEAVLAAENNKYEIDQDLKQSLSKNVSLYLKQKSRDNLLTARALKLNAQLKNLTLENFNKYYAELVKDSNPDIKALLFDTMSILKISTKSLMTSLLSNIQETGNMIILPENTSYLAQTLIMYQSDLSQALKIINFLDSSKVLNIQAYLLFMKTFAESDNNPVLNASINSQEFLLTSETNTLSYPLKSKKSVADVKLDSKNKDVFYYMTYSVLPKKSREYLNAGLSINKKIFNSKGREIKNGNLILGNDYIIEIEVQPVGQINGYVEIIDPLYAGVQPSRSENQIQGNYTFIPAFDRVNLLVYVKDTSVKVRYAVSAVQSGDWNATPVSAVVIGADEVFGYIKQKPLTIKNSKFWF
ncbi:MAG: MG2 domain-containing protein [Brevinemataceae bacterium]